MASRLDDSLDGYDEVQRLLALEQSLVAALQEAATYRLLLTLALERLHEATATLARLEDQQRQFMGVAPLHPENDDDFGEGHPV